MRLRSGSQSNKGGPPDPSEPPKKKRGGPRVVKVPKAPKTPKTRKPSKIPSPEVSDGIDVSKVPERPTVAQTPKGKRPSVVPSTSDVGPSSSKGEEINKKFPFHPVSSMPRRFKRTYLKDLSADDKTKREFEGDLLRGSRDPPIVPSKPKKGATSATVSKAFDASQKTWDKSTPCRDLLEGLNAYTARFGVPRFENALCIGLGSITGLNADGGDYSMRVGGYQLAAFKTIVQTLGCQTGKGKATPLFAQDPSFNDLDKELLRSLGIKVLEHPAIWDLLGKESLVWMPGAETKLFHGVMLQQPKCFSPSNLVTMSDMWEDGFDEFERNHCAFEFREMVEEGGDKRINAFSQGQIIYLPLSGESDKSKVATASGNSRKRKER